ncbi:MAG: putative two-component sensor histidine kinase [Polaromonas sp.]|nr:putative two-component sensor histidine kinase [Polaromonas sp.]
MKLSSFVKANLEKILLEWDVYARTLFLVAPSHLILRDHAKGILEELAQDMETAQTDSEQTEKSKGQAPEDIDRSSAASVHGELRHSSGFTLIQLTSEYRALRATVMRLWAPHIVVFDEGKLADITRFNEAIDQALAESAITFSESADRTRDTFLAILGHDLRSPLGTMSMAGAFLSRHDTKDEAVRQMGARVARSAANMAAMVGDLLEFARTQLGGGIPLTLRRIKVGDICQAALDDAQAGHPDCPFALEVSGDTGGDFDGPRLQQVMSNLLNNAAQYSSDRSPVSMNVTADAEAITVQVCNRGPVIPEQSLQVIFDPLIQLPAEGAHEGSPASSLGLGLFIAREITAAHGGIITATSSERSGTVFTVRLPRHNTVETTA